MLKIISPKGHRYYQSSIESLLDLLKVYQNFDLSLMKRKKATFLIREDYKHGLYGGAILYPQKVEEGSEEDLDQSEDTFCSAFANFRPLIEEFWIARICFCLDSSLTLEGLESIELYKKFYQNIYQTLFTFGVPKDLEFIAFTSSSFDEGHYPFCKSWPNTMIIRCSEDTSGIVNGILSLKKSRFMPRVPRGSCLEQVVARQLEAFRKGTLQ